MTRDQLHIAFKMAMDKNAQSVAFGGCPAFLPSEIDYWLNNALYQEYRKLSQEYPNVLFGGRLGMYKYFDMHEVVMTALKVAKAEAAEL